MGDINHLVYAILKFLEQQRTAGSLPDDAAESLEVASQCLESVYNIFIHEEANATRFPLPGTLPEVFAAGLQYQGVEVTADSETVTHAPAPQASDEDKEEADKYKSEGNELMKQEKFGEALECYTKAIQKDGNNAVYRCNRAAAFSKLNSHSEAIADCIEALHIDPNYSKAYGRRGLAHTAMSQHTEAIECYRKAIELDPTNQSYQNNLELAEQKLREQGPAGPMGLGGMPGMPGGGGMPGMPGGMNFGGMDFSSMLNNPALVNMASEMLANPQMQQMMSNLMSGMGGAAGQAPEGVSGLLNAGQELAQQMQNSNPELVEQLRGQMGTNQPESDNPATDDQQKPPDSSQDGSSS